MCFLGDKRHKLVNVANSIPTVREFNINVLYMEYSILL